MNPNADLYSGEQDSVPRAATGIGTITSQNTLIVGSGTSFTTQFQTGDFLYIKALNDFRKIKRITNDENMVIEAEFSAPLVAAVYHATPKTRLKEISCLVGSGGGATINGQSFGSGAAVIYTKNGQTGSFTDAYQRPVDVDATGSSDVTVIKYN